MIKARFKTEKGRDVVLLGLSHKNIDLLMKAKPIQIRGEDLNFRNVDFVIHADKDETSILKSIKEAGITLNL